MDNNSISLTETTAGQHNDELVNHDPQSLLNSMTNAANVVLEGPRSTAGQQTDSISAALAPHRAESPANDHHETGGQTVLIDEEIRKLENKARQCVLEVVKAQKIKQQLLAQEASRAKEKCASRHLTGGTPKPAQRLSIVPREQRGDASRSGSVNDPASTHKQSAVLDSAALSHTQYHAVDPEDRAYSPVTLHKQNPVPRSRVSLQPSPSLTPQMQPSASRLKSIPGSKQDPVQEISGLRKLSQPIPWSLSYRMSMPPEVVPKNFEDLKNSYLSKLNKHGLEIENFDNLRIDYKTDIDWNLDEKLYAMKRLIGLVSKAEDYDDASTMINTMMLVRIAAKNISGYFQAIANDTEVLLALDIWPQSSNDKKL